MYEDAVCLRSRRAFGSWKLCCAAKQDRLRQAKSEAEKEIAAYRAEREGAYQKKIAEVRGSTCCRELLVVCSIAVPAISVPHFEAFSCSLLSNCSRARAGPKPRFSDWQARLG